MVFSSLVFLLFFLPLTIFLYYLADDNYKNLILLLASVLFYAYGEPHFVFVMLFSIIVNYFIALLIDKTNTIIYRKLLLSVAIIINVGMLWLYKYSNIGVQGVQTR